MEVLFTGIIIASILAVLAIICFVSGKDLLGIILLVCNAAVIGAWYVCVYSAQVRILTRS